MADPINISGWSVYLGLAISGFFTGLGVVTANYVYDRWIRKHLDKLEISVNKGSIEVTTKKTLKPTGNKIIYEDEEGNEYNNHEWR